VWAKFSYVDDEIAKNLFCSASVKKQPHFVQVTWELQIGERWEGN